MLELRLLSGLFLILLAAIFRDQCLGISIEERRYRCLGSRLMGQMNCSDSAEYFLFNRTSRVKQCESIKGLCYPHRTVFSSASECEFTCAPFMVRRTRFIVTQPPKKKSTKKLLDYEELFNYG